MQYAYGTGRRVFGMKEYVEVTKSQWENKVTCVNMTITKQ